VSYLAHLSGCPDCAKNGRFTPSCTPDGPPEKSFAQLLSEAPDAAFEDFSREMMVAQIEIHDYLSPEEHSRFEMHLAHVTGIDVKA
jgi:hypothetical protein